MAHDFNPLFPLLSPRASLDKFLQWQQEMNAATVDDSSSSSSAASGNPGAPTSTSRHPTTLDPRLTATAKMVKELDQLKPGKQYDF